MSSPMPEARLLRRGLAVSVASICWTVVASTITIAAGVAESSLVLTAFGLTGLLDAAGSTALFIHFRHGLKHETFSEAHERIALRIITIGLLVVVLVTCAGSVHRLVAGGNAGESDLGLITSGASVVVLAILATVKRRVGAALPSPALSADGMLSTIGALLAAVTVCGAVLVANGIEWADPIAALGVAAGALVIAITLQRDS